MAVDPKGITPGVAPEAGPEFEVVNMRCRRPRSCDGMEADVIVIPSHPNARRYRCTTCKHMWGVDVGGSVNL